MYLTCLLLYCVVVFCTCCSFAEVPLRIAIANSSVSHFPLRVTDCSALQRTEWYNQTMLCRQEQFAVAFLVTADLAADFKFSPALVFRVRIPARSSVVAST